MRKRKSDSNRLFQAEFGMRVAIAREVRGLRQDQLATSLGLSRTAVVNIEQGRQGVSFQQALRIAKILKVSLKRITPSMITGADYDHPH